MKLHNGQYQFKAPFIMYADFEANLEPIEGSTSNPEEAYTKEINKHNPVCIASSLMGKLKIH